MTVRDVGGWGGNRSRGYGPGAVSTGMALGLTVLLAVEAPQKAVARSFSWAEARALADGATPELAVADAQRAVSAAEVSIAGTLPNPNLLLSTARETARLGATYSQPLLLFGQRSTQVRASQADLEAAGREIEWQRFDAQHNASLAWLDLWEAERRATLLAKTATDARRVNDIARERFEAGSAPRLDVVRASAGAAQASADAQAAARLVAATAARLDYFLGAAAADAASETSQTTGEPPVPETLPALETLATRQRTMEHPLLARDTAAVRAADAHVTAERRGRWPALTGDLSINWRDPTLERTDVIVGLGFELPILNLRGGAILRARGLKTLSEATRDLDQSRLVRDLRDSYARVVATARRSRMMREEVLPAMEEAVRMTEEGYQEGRSDFARILEAQRALTESRLAWVDATASAGRAFVDLERSLGGRVVDAAPLPTGRVLR